MAFDTSDFEEVDPKLVINKDTQSSRDNQRLKILIGERSDPAHTPATRAALEQEIQQTSQKLGVPYQAPQVNNVATAPRAAVGPLSGSVPTKPATPAQDDSLLHSGAVFLQGLGRGVTSGLTDYPAAGLKTLVNGMPFSANLEDMRQQNRDLMKNNKGAYLSGNLVGGGVQGALTGGGGFIPTVAKTAASGALSGYNENGDVKDAAVGAALGAGAGAVGGAVNAVSKARAVSAIMKKAPELTKDQAAQELEEASPKIQGELWGDLSNALKKAAITTGSTLAGAYAGTQAAEAVGVDPKIGAEVGGSLAGFGTGTSNHTYDAVKKVLPATENLLATNPVLINTATRVGTNEVSTANADKNHFDTSDFEEVNAPKVNNSWAPLDPMRGYDPNKSRLQNLSSQLESEWNDPEAIVMDNGLPKDPPFLSPGSQSEAIARGFANQATLGGGATLAAPVLAAIDPSNPNASYSDNVKSAIKEQTAANQQAAQTYPWMTKLGGALAVLPLGLASRIAGTGLGVTQNRPRNDPPFGTGDPDWEPADEVPSEEDLAGMDKTAGALKKVPYEQLDRPRLSRAINTPMGKQELKDAGWEPDEFMNQYNSRMQDNFVNSYGWDPKQAAKLQWSKDPDTGKWVSPPGQEFRAPNLDFTEKPSLDFTDGAGETSGPLSGNAPMNMSSKPTEQDTFDALRRTPFEQLPSQVYDNPPENFHWKLADDIFHNDLDTISTLKEHGWDQDSYFTSYNKYLKNDRPRGNGTVAPGLVYDLFLKDSNGNCDFNPWIRE